MPRDCPHCGLVNPDESRKCDCGFDFHGGPQALREVYKIGQGNMIAGGCMVALGIGLMALFLFGFGGPTFTFALAGLTFAGLALFARGLSQFWNSRHH
jgi:hypothetical protein